MILMTHYVGDKCYCCHTFFKWRCCGRTARHKMIIQHPHTAPPPPKPVLPHNFCCLIFLTMLLLFLLNNKVTCTHVTPSVQYQDSTVDTFMHAHPTSSTIWRVHMFLNWNMTWSSTVRRATLRWYTSRRMPNKNRSNRLFRPGPGLVNLNTEKDSWKSAKI